MQAGRRSGGRLERTSFVQISPPTVFEIERFLFCRSIVQILQTYSARAKVFAIFQNGVGLLCASRLEKERYLYEKLELSVHFFLLSYLYVRSDVILYLPSSASCFVIVNIRSLTMDRKSGELTNEVKNLIESLKI